MCCCGPEQGRAFVAFRLRRIQCGERAHHSAQSLKALDEFGFEVRCHLLLRLVYAVSQLVRRIEEGLQCFFRRPVLRKLTINRRLVARVGSERHHEPNMQVGQDGDNDAAPKSRGLVLRLGIGEELHAEIVG
jgi:hypothetical protein